MSPFSAVSVLSCFRKKLIPLTEKTFDEAQDALVELLEACNNERYRLRDQARDTDPGQNEKVP